MAETHQSLRSADFGVTPSHGLKPLRGKVAEAHHFVLELTSSHGVKALFGKVAEAHHFV